MEQLYEGSILLTPSLQGGGSWNLPRIFYNNIVIVSLEVLKNNNIMRSLC